LSAKATNEKGSPNLQMRHWGPFFVKEIEQKYFMFHHFRFREAHPQDAYKRDERNGLLSQARSWHTDGLGVKKKDFHVRNGS
jgi:hypothetical protein